MKEEKRTSSQVLGGRDYQRFSFEQVEFHISPWARCGIVSGYWGLKRSIGWRHKFCSYQFTTFYLSGNESRCDRREWSVEYRDPKTQPQEAYVFKFMRNEKKVSKEIEKGGLEIEGNQENMALQIKVKKLNLRGKEMKFTCFHTTHPTPTSTVYTEPYLGFCTSFMYQSTVKGS